MTSPAYKPGTVEAIAAGCICHPSDGESSESELWPGWITTGCPLHGDDDGSEEPTE